MRTRLHKPQSANGGTVQSPVRRKVMPKLVKNKPGDLHEKEADRAADEVVNKTSPEYNLPSSENEAIQTKPLAETFTPRIQAKEDESFQAKENVQLQEPEMSRAGMTDPIGEEDPIRAQEVQQQEEESVQAKEEEVQQQEEESVQAKEEEVQQQEEESVQAKEEEVQQQEEESVQAKEEETQQQEADLSSTLSATKGGGFAMDPVTLQEMNAAFGADFSNVRIHTGSAAIQMCRELGAHAFTNGNDIYFNAGKYDPYSKEGKRLLAHELTHTIQQGASGNTIQRASADASKNKETGGMPPNPMDITMGFRPTGAWLKYLEDKAAKKEKMIVNVKIGNSFSGKIEVVKTPGKKGEPAGYKLVKNNNNYLTSSGWNFFNPLKQAGVEPILVLKEIGENTPATGFLSVKTGDKANVSNSNAFFNEFNKNLDKMGFLGLNRFDAPKITNTFEAGKLNFELTNLKTTVDGFVSAEGNLSVTNDHLMFDATAQVKVPGLAEGDFMIKRDESGQLSGSGEFSADIANVKATIRAEYLEGAISIQGTGRIDSDKFSGEVTFLVTDKKRGDELMNAALGVEDVESTKEQDSQGHAPVKKTAGNQVLVGWGEVTTHITPWLAGTAKIGIDSKGDVTIVGEISVPNEVELMEERGTHLDLFSFEMRAGYGIPLLAQIFIFVKMGMFIRAGFGPLLLKDVKLEGTYSTDTSKLRNFSITGTLNINAFAMIGLKLDAGLGLTILGHDIKGGVNLTAAAGIRAYAEATPTLEYKEKAMPGGTKEAETRLKGHFEAAAQLFLMLSGSLFYEIDSPWWSPVSDGREDYPFGEMQWPLGDMGIGGDVDWLVGSPDVPELKFSPVSFDKEKFTNNILADKPYGQKGQSESDQQGTWEDGTAAGDKEQKPEVKDGEGPDNKSNQENLKKLPNEQKYMRALDELSTLENADPKPTLAVVKAKVREVKDKYGIDNISVSDKKGKAEIFVKHAQQDNSKHKLKISLMTEAERELLLNKARTDLTSRFKKDADKEGRMTKDKVNEILTDWKKHHKVVGKAWLEEKGNHWEVVMDLGDKKERLQGPLMPAEKEIKKPTTPEEHDEQVKEGLIYLKKVSLAKDEDHDNDISAKDAKDAATATKKKFPVFSSITPKLENGKWVYEWTGSPKGKLETGQEDETGAKEGVIDDKPKKGQLFTVENVEEFNPLYLAEPKEGTSNDYVGYKARHKQKGSGFNGFIVGKYGMKSNYVKTLLELKDKNKADFKKLYHKFEGYSLKQRKGQIGAGAPDHKKFKPKFIGEPIVKGDKTTIKYGYEGDNATFEVTYDNKTNETSKISAKNLAFHDLGRGEVKGETKEGMDRAHIIGNEVKGSGYIEGHNLMLTSSIFNQKTMRSAELRVGDFIKSQIRKGQKIESFDIDVTVSRYESDGKKMVSPKKSMKLRKAELEEKVSTMDEAKKETSKTYAEYATLVALLEKSDEEILKLISAKAKSSGERRVENVRYLIQKITFVEGNPIKPGEIIDSGPDVYGLEG